MKKTAIVLAVAFVFSLSISTVSAHPAVPEQSIGKVNPSAALGMHTAWVNLPDKFVPRHVFLERLRPLDHPSR